MAKARVGLLTAAAVIGAGAAEALSAPEIVYGRDDRREVFTLSGTRARNAESTVALIPTYRIVASGNGMSRLISSKLSTAYDLCPSERFRSQPTAADCSGFLAAPNIVVTAGHCVDRYSLSGIRFVFGYRMQNATQARTTIPNGDIYRGVELLADREGATDFAVVRLHRAVTGRRPLSMQRTGKANVNTSIYVIGHPSGLPAKVSAGAKVLTSKPNLFLANLDTFAGNSGSPVFNASTNAVIGVLVSGEEDYVFRHNCYVANVLSDHVGSEGSTPTGRIAPFVPPP